MKLTGRTVSDLLAAFRSSDPTPGGGSASALAGAVGASLLAMVAALPKSRATNEQDARDLSTAGSQCTTLAKELEELIDRDTAAYDMVVSAYRRPKGTDDEKVRRTEAIQRALTEATKAPLEVMRRSTEALRLGNVVGRLGNDNAASDVTVATHLLRAAIAGARANVEINLGSLKNDAYVDDVRDEVRRLMNLFE